MTRAKVQTQLTYSDHQLRATVADTDVGIQESAARDGQDADVSSPNGVRSLDRPFVILRVLRENRFPMRLTEIATAANLHVATTQRIVNLLIRHGYVERTGVEYRLGLVSLVDGFTYLSTNSLKQIAEPVLMELTASTKLTSILSVRFEFTEVSVLLVTSTPQSRFQAKVGEPVSLMDGGAGILAATLSPQELDRLLEGVEKIPLASGKVLSRQEYVDGLETIRERGYALGQGLGNRSEVSVAVPVMNRTSEVVAAIQVTGYIEEIPVDVNSLVAELKRASAAITRRVP